jgi:T6SS, Phospholipase effector Tle1-like, catalytic domain
LWKVTSDNTVTELKQCWFSGEHSSVGGGDDYHGLSDVTLAWMVQQLTYHTGLEWDIQYLLDSRQTFEPHQMDIAWGTEDFPNTFTGIWTLSGYISRTPGKYTLQPGERSNEFVHKSVLTRIKAKGKLYSHPDVSSLIEDDFGPVEERLRWP